jgi:hypothetical protein
MQGPEFNPKYCTQKTKQTKKKKKKALSLAKSGKVSSAFSVSYYQLSNKIC